MAKDLEKVIKRKVAPAVESSLHKLLGITIDELNKDITEKLAKNPFFDFPIDTSLGFRQAKKAFKKQYMQRLLRIHYGNVSEVARLAKIDRRSIHRLIKETGLNVSDIRAEMAKAYEIKQNAISNIVENVLDNYRAVIHPIKLGDVYKNINDVSRSIVDNLPEAPLSLKEAETEFEKEYLKKALQKHDSSITRTAKEIGIRYETLHRK